MDRRREEKLEKAEAAAEKGRDRGDRCMGKSMWRGDGRELE